MGRHLAPRLLGLLLTIAYIGSAIYTGWTL